jgi:hypothetical protein
MGLDHAGIEPKIEPFRVKELFGEVRNGVLRSPRESGLGVSGCLFFRVAIIASSGSARESGAYF